MEHQDDNVTLRLHRGKKVVLSESPHLLWLRQMTEKGGTVQ